MPLLLILSRKFSFETWIFFQQNSPAGCDVSGQRGDDRIRGNRGGSQQVGGHVFHVLQDTIRRAENNSHTIHVW